jgi:class 3 adenylate cyclase
LPCPACGASNEPTDKFCGERGAALVEATATPQVPERRLVTVLFADLVGFTPLSEHRDPERAIFEALGATRWLERLDAELGAVPA